MTFHTKHIEQSYQYDVSCPGIFMSACCFVHDLNIYMYLLSFKYHYQILIYKGQSDLLKKHCLSLLFFYFTFQFSASNRLVICLYVVGSVL